MTFLNAKNCTITLNGEVYAGGSAKLFEALKKIALDKAEAEAAFNACVVYEQGWDHLSGQTVYKIRCIKHLWSVEGPDKEAVKQQALIYLQQYWADGEYDDILYRSVDKEEPA